MCSSQRLELLHLQQVQRQRSSFGTGRSRDRDPVLSRCAMNLRCLWRQILRALLNVFACTSIPSLLKMFQRGLEEPVLQPVMEAVIVGTESPELPHDVLMDIFALLDIPDLVRAGSVCTSWHAAYASLCSSTEHCSLLQQTPATPYASCTRLNLPVPRPWVSTALRRRRPTR